MDRWIELMGVLPVAFAVACVEVPPAEPRAPEPVFRGLPAAALPKPKRDFLGWIGFQAEHAELTTRIALDVVVPGAPVLDPERTPEVWAESACQRLLAEGCTCTVESADTLRADLATCGPGQSGILKLRFSAVEEDPALASPRAAIVDVTIDDLLSGTTRFGFVRGVLSTTDGSVFTTVRPFSTPDTPLVPERATPEAPPLAPPPAQRPSVFARAYRAFSWALEAVGCFTRSRC